MIDQEKPVPNCLNCAWREACQKRYGKPPDYAKHCADYTFDVRLRQREKSNESTTRDKNQ